MKKEELLGLIGMGEGYNLEFKESHQKRHLSAVETAQESSQKFPRFYPETISKLSQNYSNPIWAIVEAMCQDRHINLEELDKASDMGKSGVKYAINRLKREKIIRRTDGSKAGHWEVQSTQGKRGKGG